MVESVKPENVPLSIYLHWPWCVRKCPYCDFNSHGLPAGASSASGSTGLDPQFERIYVDAVLKDLESWGRVAEDVFDREVVSVFLGGGTPSLLSGKAVSDLIKGIRARFRLAQNVEITMEANPGASEAGRFAAYREAGVNRLSIGVQSMSDERLRKLGRIHTVREAESAAKAARENFENFNLDLMYALPGQNLAALGDELNRILDLGSTHLSCYQLTIEEGTAFAKHEPEGLPDEDLAAEMGDRLVSELARAGFRRYEVSGYAKAGWECRHNKNYWTFGDYIAAGPGAHGKLSYTDSAGEFAICREARCASPRKWLAAVNSQGVDAAGAFERRLVAPSERPFEFMLNALRLIDGVPTEFFEARTGLGVGVIEDKLNELRRKGFLAAESHKIAPTPRGIDFLSDLQEAFL